MTFDAAAIVFMLGYGFLFKSILGCCDMWVKGLLVDKIKQKTESHLYDCFKMIFFWPFKHIIQKGTFIFTFFSFLILFCSNGKIWTERYNLPSILYLSLIGSNFLVLLGKHNWRYQFYIFLLSSPIYVRYLCFIR